MRVGFVLRLTLVFFAAGGPAEAVQGQVQEPRLRMAVDATQVTVGGRLRLTVAVEHDPEAAVQWPDSLDLGPFEVLEAGAVPPTREGDRMVTAAVFTLTAFELGELEIPSFELIVAAPDGSETVLPTDPFVIEVVSVGPRRGIGYPGREGTTVDPAQCATFVALAPRPPRRRRGWILDGPPYTSRLRRGGPFCPGGSPTPPPRNRV